MSNVVNLESIRNEIHKVSDIVDIISQHLNLTKKGNNYVALCPFHSDNSPSLTVSSSKGLYKCFACGEGGDVVKFVKNIKNITYIQALEELCNYYNLTSFDFTKFKNTNDFARFYNDEQKKSIEVLETAKFIYKTEILKNKKAYEYLQKRELADSEIIEKFQIGFAPEQGIKQNLLNLNYSENNLVNAGLLNLELNEFFKNRITFGINDEDGNIIGFSARALGDYQPKYINSPETTLFNKSDILYNYFNAKDYIFSEKEVIIVEGFMDVIALYKANIKNVVAIMGTALTKNHLKLIQNKKVCLFLDNDDAGKNATLKSIKTLVQNGFGTIEIVENNFEKDADEILKYEGKQQLQDLVKVSRIHYINYIYNTLLIKHNLLNLNNSIPPLDSIKSFSYEIKDILIYVQNKSDLEFIVNNFKQTYNYTLLSESEITNIINKNFELKKHSENFLNKNDFFVNELSNDFNYELSDNINSINDAFKTNELWFNNNNFKTQKQQSLKEDLFGNNYRILFMLFMLSNQKLANAFYNLPDSDLLFQHDEVVSNLYYEIKEQIKDFVDEENVDIVDVVKQQQAIIKQQLKQKIIDKYLEISNNKNVTNDVENEINNILTQKQQLYENSERGEILNPLLNEELKQFKDFYQKITKNGLSINRFEERKKKLIKFKNKIIEF
ncbi:DNA primase [Mycoplasma leonicaptivi]|uniref:DNA primase n=1 Tax=Mycoplasma leonicaptivi TaxID=36742 RepID=UPI000684EA78|nr:DNA primase [Mycoplasma leonicaptivi]